MSTLLTTETHKDLQIHNLYGDIAIISRRDRVGSFINERLEYCRSDYREAKYEITVEPAVDSGKMLRKISKIADVEYAVDAATGKPMCGFRDVYWSYDDLGAKYMKVVYTPSATPGKVWRVVEQWIKICFLQMGWAPVHSAAFIYRDVPAIVVGWERLGKSRFLHYALDHGAAYVSDDFTWVSPEGKLRGHPETMVETNSRFFPQIRNSCDGSAFYKFRRRAGEILLRLPRTPSLINRAGKRLARFHNLSMRMDRLHPELKIVAEASEPIWIVIVPALASGKTIERLTPPEEAMGRILTSTLVDHYFSQYYIPYLYQSGCRPQNDYLLTRAWEAHAAILEPALHNARGLLAVPSEIVINSPELLLDNIFNK